MRLRSARIRNFKHFNDLSIKNLPVSAKLIVVLGTSGDETCALFDAFQRYFKTNEFYGMSDETKDHYRAVASEATRVIQDVNLEFHNDDPATLDESGDSFFIRSEDRLKPHFHLPTIKQQPNDLDRHAIQRLIDADQTDRENLQRAIWRFFGNLMTPELRTEQTLHEKTRGLISTLKSDFKDFNFDKLASSVKPSKFTFGNGESNDFFGINLLAMAGVIYDLLPDILGTKSEFHDSLFFFDKQKPFISTGLRGSLLKKLYPLAPEDSQLWLAAHSVGMVLATHEIYEEFPQDIVFLDMGYYPDGSRRDYNEKQIIRPSKPDDPYWKRHYDVAQENMGELKAIDRIVLCEGHREDDGPAFDEACYNKIFTYEFPLTRFVSVGSAAKVEKRFRGLPSILQEAVDNAAIVRFRDRDELTLEEIEEKREAGIRVMSGFRNIESMLLSDGVLQRLCDEHGKPDRFAMIRKARDTALDKAIGSHASDNLKPAVQAVLQEARRQLQLNRPGESKEEFMHNVLAPLIAEGTSEYRSLKSDIFGKSS